MIEQRSIIPYGASGDWPWPRNVRLVLSVGSLGLTAVGWLWFAICFTATYQAWWNSLWVLVFTFGLALAIACVSPVAGGRSRAIGFAIAGCTWAGVSFLWVLILAIP